MNKIENNKYSKIDVCEKLNISLATFNNWLKTKLVSSPKNGLYSQEEYLEIVQKIEKSTKLKSRANRNYQNSTCVTYLGIKKQERKDLLHQLISKYEDSNLSIFEGIRHLGTQILISNNLLDENTEIFSEIGKVENNIFSDFFIENEDDDILGAFYQSIQSIASKSKQGSYYTPKELLKNIKIPENQVVLDPCCGSGGILINVLSKNHIPEKIWAYDTDEIAILICKVNLILFFNNSKIKLNIKKKDFIFGEKEINQFDYIITNPPWGSKLKKKEKDFILSEYQEISTTEVFSVILYNAINCLSKMGKLYFFLPESILNVTTHKSIRKYLLNLKRDIEITPLGNAFKGVQSECILMKICSETENQSRIKICKDPEIIFEKENIKEPNYLISYNISVQDEKILNKIYNSPHRKLPLDTKFALGIVTGNNKQHLSSEKKDGEEIYRGKDISPYKLKESQLYINFTPEKFQQVAPVENYRTKKIVYRFISNKIICALDSEKKLLLNSANLIISENYPMEILTCLYNSCIYSFIYQKKFKSKKLLKQHFQDFPLPILSQELENELSNLYDKIVKKEITQELVDSVICKYFGISTDEYDYIKGEIYGKT